MLAVFATLDVLRNAIKTVVICVVQVHITAHYESKPFFGSFFLERKATRRVLVIRRLPTIDGVPVLYIYCMFLVGQVEQDTMLFA